MEPESDAWQPSADELAFVEEVALVFERMGLVRMTGRTLGWLMICDPPEQTFAQVAAGLGASKGSISAALKTLTGAQWVERFGRPGQRRDLYRMREGGFEELTWAQLQGVGQFVDLAGRGLAMMPAEQADRRRRLQGIHDLFAWLDAEIPRLRERWDRRRKE